MNPLLYGFYQFLKLIVRLALRTFYPYKVYLNKEGLRADYPAIIVSNHPNTLMDPLTVAAKTKRVVFFLANAGLFKSSFGHWFFNTFYCIPVQRPQDKGGKKKISNEASFSRANEHLTKGGLLYIAAEGTSEMERRLRPLKTGTARIALSTEKKNNYQLGMAIIPVGLTYAHPDQCGSRVVVNVGEPISPKEYQAAYEADPIRAVRKLTSDLEERMSSLLIDTRDEAEDLRLRLLESIQQNEQPLRGAARFRREMSLLEKMRDIKEESLFPLLDQYRAFLEKHKIKDSVIRSKSRNGFSLTDLLGLPVYLYGWINNFLGVRIPVLVSRQLNLYKGYNATVKILVALITIPFFYWLQTKVVGSYFGDVVKWLYFVSLPISGVLAWKLGGQWKRWVIQQRFRRMTSQNKEELQQLREKIVEQMREL